MQTLKSPAGEQGKKNDNLNSLDNNYNTKNAENQEKNTKVVNLYEIYENYRLPSGYIIDNLNLSRKIYVEIRINGGRDKVVKEETQTICRFFVVEKIIKQEENTLITLKFKDNYEIIAEASIIADSKKLAETLCRNGVIITAKTAKILTEYVAEFLKLNEKKIIQIIEKNETGWDQNNEIFFAPALVDNTIQFSDTIADSLIENGDEKEQIKLLQEIFTSHTGAATILLIGLTATLIKPLNLQHYTIYIAGKPGSGKSLANSILLSTIGKSEKLINNMNATINAIEKKINIYKDLPAVLDELETAGRNESVIHDTLINLIYNFYSGEGRSRLNKAQNMQKINKYRSLLFISAERSMLTILAENTTDKANLGTLRRVIEINANKVKLFKDNCDYKNIADSIAFNHGYILKKWINLLKDKYDEIEYMFIAKEKKNNKIDILDLAKIIYPYFAKLIDVCINDEIINKIDMIIADNEKIYCDNVINEESKYVDYIQEFIAANQNNFIDEIEKEQVENDNKIYKVSGRILGQFNKNDTTYIINECVLEICKKYKIEKENLLNVLKLQKILIDYKVVKINKKPARAYILRLDENE